MEHRTNIRKRIKLQENMKNTDEEYYPVFFTFRRILLTVFVASVVMENLLIVEAITTNFTVNSAAKVVLKKVLSCYYYPPGKRNDLPPQSLPAGICTHINVAFAKVDDKKIKFGANLSNALIELVKLKKYNPRLKILLSIGGGSGAGGFPEMVKTHTSRKIFIESMKEVLINYSLDGVDLDWEFPESKSLFSKLLQEIREEYNTMGKEYILTIAALSDPKIYDVHSLNLYVDFVNIMTYDYHSYSSYSPNTGFNSPLNSKKTANQNCLHRSVELYLSNGLDRNKINVGIPTYGYSYTLTDPKKD